MLHMFHELGLQILWLVNKIEMCSVSSLGKVIERMNINIIPEKQRLGKHEVRILIPNSKYSPYSYSS
jgi:hypothetical protein